MDTRKCEDGCNDAEFILVNGDEKQYLCEPSFMDRLLDLVKNNDQVTFRNVPKEDGLQVIKII